MPVQPLKNSRTCCGFFRWIHSPNLLLGQTINEGLIILSKEYIGIKIINIGDITIILFINTH